MEFGEPKKQPFYVVTEAQFMEARAAWNRSRQQ
jgi:hypothetical protein